MKKQKKRYLKDEIMDAIRAKGTFDLKDNPKGHPTIHWLIAEYILKDNPATVGYKSLLRDYAKAIARSLDSVIKELSKKHQTCVYRGTGISPRIEFVTTNPSYRNAKEEDCKRDAKRFGNHVVIFVEKHPRYLPEVLTKQLLLSDG